MKFCTISTFDLPFSEGRHWKITLFFFILTFSSIGQNLQNGLIVHYKTDGNFFDSSGANLHGTPTNVTYGQDHNGNPNSAASFNGNSSQVILPNASVLKPGFPITIALYVKFNSLTVNKSYIFDTDYTQNNHSGVWLNLTGNGTLSVSFGDAQGGTTSGNRRSFTGTTQIQPNIWYHVVVIIKSATDMEIYIDCNKENGSYSGSGGTLIGYTNDPGSIGVLDVANQNPYHFSGQIDDWRMWNRVLTPLELSIVCGSTPMPNPGLIPKINLGNDTALCSGQSLTFDVRQGFPATYLWSNGSNDSVVTLPAPGTYWVQISTADTTVTDT
ncbi:MAG: LamG domain-containing protein, partial [Bacteroidota bacterium]|nr:LamG domain-containing protein [Bacteroidota bacterium]